MLGEKQEPNMGDFDDRISALRQQRDLAFRDLEDMAKGAKHLWNGADITEKRKKRLQRIVADLDATIAAYEAHNAEGP